MIQPVTPDELSRRSMLLMVQADKDLAALESDPKQYSVARFHEIRQAILDYRTMLQQQYEREKAATP